MGVDDLKRKRITIRIMRGTTRSARLLCLIAGLLLSLIGASRAEQLPIKNYTTADGLARDQINRIVRDSHGFLWFCTEEGLSRFDGYKFTNYTTDQGLPHRQVNALLETRTGVYWIATTNGLVRFNPDGVPLFVVYHPAEIPKEQEWAVNALIEDRAGHVWCGTNHGIYRVEQEGEQWQLRFVDIGIPAEAGVDPSVETLLEDRRGALWVGTVAEGLFRHWPGGRSERYAIKLKPALGNARIRALFEDKEGQLWAGTSGGLCRLVAEPKPQQPIVARLYTTKDGLPRDWVNAILQSSDGKLWVGIDGGLSEFLPTAPTANEKQRKFRMLTTAQGLSSNRIEALAEDHDGNLWIGSANNGAMKLARSGFTTFGKSEGVSSVKSIIEDRAQELCLVMQDSELYIACFDGQRFNATRPAYPRNIYGGWGWSQSGLQDRAGEWWLPTGEGLYRFPQVGSIAQLAHTRPKAAYTTREGLFSDQVFRLFEDSHGDIWIATNGGKDLQSVTRWERSSETFHSYSQTDGLPPAILATSFGEDSSGSVWVGTAGSELARYGAGRFTVFTTADGVPKGWIRAIYLDHSGRLWIASGQGGVGRIDDPQSEHPRFIAYTTADGLSSNQVNCVTEDQWGRIYLGTGRGLDRLDPATGHIKHYTAADGLVKGEVLVALRDHQGVLWFGGNGNNELSRFVPETDAPHDPPPILVSALKIAGNPYRVSELGATEVSLLELAPDRNQLNIEFVGLSFGAGETLRYQFMLEGADKDWGPLTDQRAVSYARLAPGRYRFLVRAVNDAGVSSQTPARITFTILPPLWQRWWFLTLAVLVACLVVYQIYRYRVARLLGLERVRTRIATDLHDDIGSNLSLIAGLSDMLRQQALSVDTKIAERLSVIENVSQRSVDAMSDIVWAVNPHKDHLRDLLQRMRRFASDTFSARNIQLVFRAPDADQSIKLGAETRREVFLIFKESVNNAARHSGCVQANVSVAVTNGSLSFSVVDNGKGFDADRVEAGEGLLSMRRRAEKIGGVLVITSRAGTGTTVLLKAPLL
jgi:ligand-binding sensor domain-containing protein/two-component sensor histidine kinase